MFQDSKSFSGEEIYKMSNSDLWGIFSIHFIF